MLHHIAHAAEDHRFIVASGFEELGQLGFAPVPRPSRFSPRRLEATQPSIGALLPAVIIAFAFAERFFLHRQATRGMTGAAVAQPSTR